MDLSVQSALRGLSALGVRVRPDPASRSRPSARAVPAARSPVVRAAPADHGIQAATGLSVPPGRPVPVALAATDPAGQVGLTVRPDLPILLARACRGRRSARSIRVGQKA